MRNDELIIDTKWYELLLKSFTDLQKRRTVNGFLSEHINPFIIVI